jgi:hypothetical protein
MIWIVFYAALNLWLEGGGGDNRSITDGEMAGGGGEKTKQ